MNNVKPTVGSATAKAKTSRGKKSSRKRSRKPSINSRQKGVNGELEFRDVLRSYGFEAIRGQQHAGDADAPDVKHNIPGVHFEVKRKEAGNLYSWLEQATTDAATVWRADVSGGNPATAGRKIPVVAHKRNYKQWVAILDMKDFIDIMLRVLGI